MATTTQPIVIIGAGQAGGRAAEALREGGHTGPITLIGDEIHLPYERPALSKEFLADDDIGRIAWIRHPSWYTDADIGVRSNTRAISIDRARRIVKLDSQADIPFQTLILATGTRPRRLAVDGADHPLCTYLRTIEDSRRLRKCFRPAAHIVVIGAGFIGLEVAAAARLRGCEVTVLEVGKIPMARAVPPQIGTFYAQLHREKGVVLRTETTVSHITDHNGRAAVHLQDGETLLADAVVIGIGVVPNTELAETADLQVENGIVTDAFGCTSDSHIYAAGDVTSHFNPLLGHNIRLESWQNAQNQAIAVARNILGAAKPYAEVPWFWSDQYGLNLQIAGVPRPGDEIVQRGTLGDGPALLLHLRDERLVAAVGIDSGRDIRFSKEIIMLGGKVALRDLANPGIKLADLYRTLKQSEPVAP
jgi:NADPH-dependent 2,4-dienoyl-CoA reductase/sulfur reductase-like enzyme